MLLLAGGLLTSATYTAVYQRVRETDAALALWGFLFAVFGSFGAAMHGAYDLANLANVDQAPASQGIEPAPQFGRADEERSAQAVVRGIR